MMQLITYNSEGFLCVRSRRVQVSYFIPLQKQLPPLWWTRAAKTNAICHRHVGSMFIVINNSREKERRAALRKESFENKTNKNRDRTRGDSHTGKMPLLM